MKRRRGVILVLVLLILLVVVALVLGLGRDVKTELDVAGMAADEVRLRCLVDSAIDKALAELRADATAGDDLRAAWRNDDARFKGYTVEGQGRVWLLIAEPDPGDGREVRFGIRDEASKLDVNFATRDQLLALTGITEDAADGIIDWRDEDDDISDAGAERGYYASLKPPYLPKNSFIESLDELRRIRGIDDAMLHGEDRNRNGVLDPGEDDGDKSFPPDDADGQLDRGLVDQLTVFAREPNLRKDGQARLDYNAATPQELDQALTQAGMAPSAQQRLMFNKMRGNDAQSMAQLLSPPEIDEAAAAIVLDQLTIAADAPVLPGRINVNTAGRTILAGLPGLEAADVDAILSGRLDAESDLTSPAWLLRVLAKEKFLAVVDLVTARSEQFTIDVVALLDGGEVGGGKGRFKRVEVLVDRTQVPMRVMLRRDLTSLGFPFVNERGEGLP